MGLFSGPKSQMVEIAGAVLSCSHCKNQKFHKDTRLLNSAGASFLGFDWANKQATIYICDNCRMIHWFAE